MLSVSTITYVKLLIKALIKCQQRNGLIPRSNEAGDIRFVGKHCVKCPNVYLPGSAQYIGIDPSYNEDNISPLCDDDFNDQIVLKHPRDLRMVMKEIEKCGHRIKPRDKVLNYWRMFVSEYRSWFKTERQVADQDGKQWDF